MKIDNKTQHSKDMFTGITPGDEWSGEENSIPICDYCSVTTVKLMDSSGKNLSYFCNRCQITREPGETRKKSKLSIQKQEVDPAVTSVGNIPDVSIRHEPTLSGGFAQLAKKGTIRFTSYSTTEKE
jgi:hypothetical protein